MAELFKVNAPVRKPLFEGVQGENEARSIQFDITPWVEELGDGAVTATAKRSQDSQPYPVTVTKVGTIVTWKPTSTDTAFAGVGSFQLEYTVDSVLAKTCIWSTMVAPSLDPAGDPPDPYDNWLAEMREIAADAIQAAQDADDSADDAQAEVYEAEAWAKGTKNGTPVSSSDSQYQNNSKYFAEESYKNAEAWAVGQRGGVDVPSTDPTYENNAKYWAGKSEELKDETQAIVDEARTDVFEAMDGLHEETTAGSALQLISDKYTENKEPYLFRKSIAGDRELDALVGGSVAWNQLVSDNFGSIQSASVAFNAGTQVISSHKYLFLVKREASTIGQSCYVQVYTRESDTNRLIASIVFGTGSELSKYVIVNTLYGGISDGTSDSVNGNLWIYQSTGSAKCSSAQFFDLTTMFGTAVADSLYAMEQAQAGSGVALFRSWFPKDYYAYNTGELMSVKTSAHEMVGFNQWDEEWETYGSSQIKSKTLIPVLPNTEYYVQIPTGHAVNFYFRGANNERLGDWGGRGLFTTPNGCVGMWLYTGAYGATYNHDICVNLSDPTKNGTYEPYVKRTYPLDSSLTLRGIPKLDAQNNLYYDGDTYEADGTVTRKYGIVDLGTLDWTYQSANTRFYSPTIASTVKGVGSSVKPNAIATRYMCNTFDAYGDKEFSFGSTGNMFVKDSSYTDAATFKTAMSGVYLVYELATPTTETADPFVSPQIVDPNGTERYVDERDVAVPVGHVTKYPEDLVAKLDGLPWDFSTLIAPTEKAYTATRNYTTGSLFIVGNILYKATANIANGGTITPNTNCTATTLAEVISAL